MIQEAIRASLVFYHYVCECANQTQLHRDIFPALLTPITNSEPVEV